MMFMLYMLQLSKPCEDGTDFLVFCFWLLLDRYSDRTVSCSSLGSLCDVRPVSPCSQTGKKLMAKCRMLIQENQELGRQLSQGRIAQLEAELALQKKYSEELKSSQDGERSSSEFAPFFSALSLELDFSLALCSRLPQPQS